jgi:sec-independent protein translocase protein TatA
MLRDLGGWHFLIILAVLVLLFGATKLPALAKGVGQSVKIFRKELGGSAGDQPEAAQDTAVVVASSASAE